MLKRPGRLGRAVVIAIAGWSFGLAGVAGEAHAQCGGMKKDDAKVDGKAMPKDDKMKRGEQAMEKKRRLSAGTLPVRCQ